VRWGDRDLSWVEGDRWQGDAKVDRNAMSIGASAGQRLRAPGVKPQTKCELSAEK
jgi:hypothetical protein